MAEKKASKLKVKIPKFNTSNKTYDFSLSFPGMISAVGAGVLALTFFFVMGILIGRGYRPEADVPQLKGIMPTKEHGQIAEVQEKPEILKAEDLEYPNRLKETPEAVMKQPQPDAKKLAPKVEKKLQAPAPVKPAKVEDNPVKPEVYQPEAPKPGEPVFDYVYQVASFRKAEMADALSAKLVAAGLRTAVTAGEAKGTTWYRVQVLHHGTPESTEGMKAILTQQGMGKPLLRKKTPAQ